jgi:hypothetical protein
MNLKILKKTAKKRFLLIIMPILVAAIFTLVQCNKERKCENVACTDIYMTVSLKLQYPDEQPVLLDSSKVFWVSENRYLEPNPVSWNEGSIWGSYLIVDDGMQKELLEKKEVMHFTGYLYGDIVCERDVLVGADCCHVNYLGTEPLTETIKVRDCEGVFCEMIYTSICLKLKYPDEQPVLLDSSKVFWVSENRYLEQNPFWWNEYRKWGDYLIVGDEMQKKLFYKKKVMHFTGYLNGNIVCERDVLVGADCCHVNYLGTESLTQIIQYE